MKRLLLALALVLAGVVAVVATASAESSRLVDVVVVMRSQANLAAIRQATRPARLAEVERTLRAHAAQAQRGVLMLLAARRAQRLVSSVVPLWIANEIEVQATPAVIRELAARPDVREIRPNFTIQAPAAPASATASTTSVEPNVDLVNAPAIWAMGLGGQGIVVANMDTGVDATHPDLANKWRGGTNSWYDPNGQHPTTPTDVNGHGTQTMGVMVGGDAGGSSIGVAPEAKWIAVKIFNDRGTATSSGIHLGFQWLLDPDGDPATADAPNVVNDSWTMGASGCNLDFQLDLRSLRAAGILPVFAAGNYGPTAGTVFSPANNPEAFAVGGTDNADVLDPYSSRGPSACTGTTSPKLTAPGVSIRTTDLYGGYATDTGTSVAAPHVSGALALLLNAFPSLSADQQEAALDNGALDLGSVGVDNDYGYGRLDVLAAYQWLASVPDFTVSASPASLTVSPGGNASFAVSISGTNGFSGDVSLSLAGLSGSQAGWSFAPPAVTGGSGTSQLSVTTSSTIAPGSYPLTITGTSGSITRTATATLDVSGPPDFSVLASPSSQSVTAGNGASYSVTVGALNGFTGDVALTVTGLPASVGSASLTPAVVTDAGTSQLAISTSVTAAPGSYPLTVTGTSGSTSHSSPVTLVVSAPPDFSLGVTPSSRTVSAGATATYTASIGALNGFTGGVALSVSGLPGSVGTATFTPAAVSGAGSSQLTIHTAANAPSGSYPLTVTGTSGATTHTAAVTLVVAARDFAVSASPASVTIYRGQTASYTVTVSTLGGFTGNVTLALSGAPSGSSASWTGNPVPAPGSATLRVRSTGSTPRGTFTLRITGTSGSLSHQVTVTLIVR
jgi:subtilisin family serine protease